MRSLSEDAPCIRSCLMNWNELLRLPATLLAIVAALLLLLALMQLLAARQHVHHRRHLRAVGHTVLLLLWLLLAVGCAGLAMSLRGYRMLDEETPVVQLDTRILTPQHWVM